MPEHFFFTWIARVGGIVGLGEAMLGELVCYGVVDWHRLAPTGRVGRVWWLTPIALQCATKLTGKIERRDPKAWQVQNSCDWAPLRFSGQWVYGFRASDSFPARGQALTLLPIFIS